MWIMRKSTIIAEFKADKKSVWDVVTNNEDYGWRSDLSKIEVKENGKQFIEYTKGGFATTFTITKKEPYVCYAFDMENQNFHGHWKGLFSQTPEGGTKIEFTEELEIPNKIMEILSYGMMPLKKIQKTYIKDLKRKLGEEG